MIRTSGARVRTAAAGLAIASIAVTASRISFGQESSGEAFVVVSPTRRAPAPTLVAPPSLLPGAQTIRPLRFDVVTRHKPRKGRASEHRQTVSRTNDRVHMRTDSTEWLFERNPVDPRRVSGLLVDHATRTIVMHEESDLRNALGVKGWADIIMIGFDAGALEHLQPRPEWHTKGGIAFRKHVSVSGNAGVSEVWWSHEHVLPLGFVLRDTNGTTQVSLERVTTVVEDALLRPPSTRYPQYKVVELSDWLEGP